LSRRAFIWWGMILGSCVGGWVPTAFGADAISFAALGGSVVGGLGGIWLGSRFGE